MRLGSVFGAFSSTTVICHREATQERASSKLSPTHPVFQLDMVGQAHRPETPQDWQDWTRHPELYFADGIIVLLAESTVFRVHASILSLECGVFRHMLAASTDTDILTCVETYDGCRLLRLSDEPEFLMYFLKALMGHIHLLDPDENHKYSIAALAILHLSHKYKAERHEKKAIQ
ncbi:hypothetical protein M422DRAFT_257849 [Sphaerobolus stellatus SS14]|uniref:BTB domain-containing protein n=1 Tax=Sphaerobolus stellatus (strain SS14) TaxID=990650 RepID=A0A0C9VCI9_SPHS4|nr:hypothetical protein M422DRAFT_257849 [Sphaerobolus stellatus SS14]